MASTTPSPERSSRRHRKRGEPQAFDFRSPTTMSREHIRTLQIVQETLARGFTTTLASALRAVTNVSIRNIEQRPYDEYVRQMPTPGLLTMLSLRPLSGLAILQIPLPVAYIATEMLLGGTGSANQPQRSMTDLELALMRNIVEQTLPEIRYAFESVAPLEPSIVGQESNPQFAQLASPTDMVVVVAFDIKIESVTDVMTLCIPFASLQPHLEALSDAGRQGGQSADKMASDHRRLADHIAGSEVETRATFRPAVASSSQIVALAIGDTLLLNHPLDMPLTLQTGGVPIYDVKIGRVNRQLALEVEGAVPSDRFRRRNRLQVVRARAS